MTLASSARSPIKIGMWLLLAPLCLWLLLLIILPHVELLSFSITDPEQGGLPSLFTQSSSPSRCTGVLLCALL